MKIGITGADGLIGSHLKIFLYATAPNDEVRLATRATFQSPELLSEFVADLDVVFHCAGKNRGDESEVEQVNIWLAQSLVAALGSAQTQPTIVYTNSTHITRDTAYGRGKKTAAATLQEFCARTEARMVDVILPNVFGEFGRPFYNSVVSTFCFQLANGHTPKVDNDATIELVHAQEVAKFCISAVRNTLGNNNLLLKGTHMSVSALLELLSEQSRQYAAHVIPDLRSPLHLRLFNTLRSYLYPSHYPCALQLHGDERGGLFEAVKTHQGGQVFFSTTKPGVTRGNHFHLRKVERFLVVSGEAEICLRRIFDDKVERFRVSGTQPAYIDMPTMHTHNITNVGASDVQTMFWTNEIFDPADTDTFAEPVLI